MEGCEEMKEWEEGGMRTKVEGNREGRRKQKGWGEGRVMRASRHGDATGAGEEGGWGGG